jgi:hypothetical protein
VIEEIEDMPNEGFDLNDIPAEEENDAPVMEEGQFSFAISDVPHLCPGSNASINDTRR